MRIYVGVHVAPPTCRNATAAADATAPRATIAAGLGGLDWGDVRETISMVVPDHIDVVVYTPPR